jgi:type IV secretion system protein VirB8
MDKTQAYLETANDWETSRIHEVERRARRAERDKYIAFGLVATLTLAIALMLPLKQKVPYLIREDKVTGAVDVVGQLGNASVEYSEARDKYWLARYVTARESYDWFGLQNNYDTTRLLSTDDIAKSYAQKFDGADALDKKYKNNVRIDARIVSIVLDNKQTATVRFQTRILSSGTTNQTQGWVATISFEYDSAEKLDESQRLINPFGFQVTSYRVDPELVSTPASASVVPGGQSQPPTNGGGAPASGSPAPSQGGL